MYFNNVFCLFLDVKKGWIGLYNSRLIGGGIRLRQKRIENGILNNANYGPGWTEYIKVDNKSTPWMYSKSLTKNFIFFSK